MVWVEGWSTEPQTICEPSITVTLTVKDSCDLFGKISQRLMTECSDYQSIQIRESGHALEFIYECWSKAQYLFFIAMTSNFHARYLRMRFNVVNASEYCRCMISCHTGFRELTHSIMEPNLAGEMVYESPPLTCMPI